MRGGGREEESEYELEVRVHWWIRSSYVYNITGSGLGILIIVPSLGVNKIGRIGEGYYSDGRIRHWFGMGCW
jgi:hypothetical protein